MNWADYQVGRRVVCVEDFNDAADFCSVIPKIGRVYTIRDASMGFNFCGVEVFSLKFDEFSSFGIWGAEYQPPYGEWSFQARCFKPLDERRLDQFRQMLTKIPSPWEHAKDHARVDA